MLSAARNECIKRAPHLWRIMYHPAHAISKSRKVSTSEPIVNKKLDGKVAIITGAASGIGMVTAKLFADHGAQVIIADIADENGHRVASEIGSSAHYKHCDVAKEADVASVVDFAVEKFGKLDIMFNNAGIVTPKDHNIHELDMEDYDRFSSIMVRGVVVGIKHASRVMIPAKQGVILTTASIVSVATCAAFPLVYSMNKSNLPGITKIASYRLGKHGIRVNAISPGVIVTPRVLHSFKKLGVNLTFDDVLQRCYDQSTLAGKRCTHEDSAKGALFLCSDDSGYISGHNLFVDGGWCNTKEFKFF